jgi:uncharacterized protein (DUF1015 family)
MLLTCVQTLPSDPDSGLTLAPFRGIRYAPDRVSGIANVTSPPYDLIGAGNLDRLLSADPHNIVRLILPGFPPGLRPGGGSAQGPGGGSAQAAGLLRDWLAAGVLVKDDEAALYVYEQSGPGWRQRGLIGLVPVGSPAIMPHEDVMPGAVAGRRELMAATQANLEPIFLVYEGGGAPLPAEAEPQVSAVTGDGVAHALWRVNDPAAQTAIAARLAGRRALIADGHHRYAAYAELRMRMHDAGLGHGPWDYGLAFLVDSDAHPPRLGAVHRVLPGLPPLAAAGLAKEAFAVRDLPADLAAGLRALAESGRNGPSFLLAGDCASWHLLTDPDPAALAASMPPGRPRAWQRLDASVLQQLVFGRLWGIEDNENDVLVSHDAADAVRMACQAGGTAVLSNPVPLAAVREIAENGGRVPRKSTSFVPKPRSGLVFRTFD